MDCKKYYLLKPIDLSTVMVNNYIKISTKQAPTSHLNPLNKTKNPQHMTLEIQARLNWLIEFQPSLKCFSNLINFIFINVQDESL